MNQKNLDYLYNQLQEFGFGAQLQDELKEKMEQNSTSFKLDMTINPSHIDRVEASLKFSRSKESDFYFFNSYNLHLNRNGIDGMSQTFYINKGNTIHVDEAYNLMNGRTVNKDLVAKDGHRYNAWLKLDFESGIKTGNFKMTRSFGFDVEKELKQLSINGMIPKEVLPDFLESLKKGNREAVTFKHTGANREFLIEANPVDKKMNIYDENMQVLDTRQFNVEKQQNAKMEMQSNDQVPDRTQAEKKRKGLSR